VYLHRHDVLHGDLTAANVLLVGTRHRERNSRSFQAKVADFGLSRFMEAAQLTTATFGTVSHMPLELIAHGRLSKAVDVYSMGVLLHEVRPWLPVCRPGVTPGGLEAALLSG
jgi:serine/threonine protein kinase